MIRRVCSIYPQSVTPSPLSHLFAYFRFVGYRFARGCIQVLDGLLSLLLAPLGMDTEIYARFIYRVEKYRKPLWNRRYQNPNSL